MPLTHRRRPTPLPPPLPGRDFLRLLSAFTLMVLILWAMTRVGNPRTWSWVTAMQPSKPADKQPSQFQPEALPKEKSEPPEDLNPQYTQTVIGQAVACFAMGPNPFAPVLRVSGHLGVVHGLEFVPRPVIEPPAPVKPRRHAWTADPAELIGAYDKKGFLVDDPNDDSHANVMRRGDARARYHLLDLACHTSDADLASDAKTDFRYSALLAKPADYRGEILRIEGQLRWLRTFELQKDRIAGEEFVYEGLMTVGTDAYWVLFKDLPKGLPPKSEWANLYVHEVRFNGYFYKALQAEGDKKTVSVPCLIGRTIQLPSPVASTPFEYSLLTLLAVVGGAGAVMGVFFWLHGRGEKRHAAKLAAARERARANRVEEPSFPTDDGGVAPRRAGWREPSEN